MNALYPYRHATRLINAFQFTVGTANFRNLEGDFEAALLACAIHRQALSIGSVRKVSINGIATSFAQSTETLRRAGRALVERGLCRTTPRGIEIQFDFFANTHIVRMRDDLEIAFLDLLRAYRRSGLRLPENIEDRSRPAMIAAALDIQLSAQELSETRISRPTRLHVLGTVAVLNAALLTEDPALGLRYGHDATVPPDDFRLPVSAQTVARAIGLPRTTVRRHLDEAERGAQVRRVEGGEE